MGHADRPNLLDFDAIPDESSDRYNMSDAKLASADMLLCVLYYFQMLVAYIFDDIELAIKVVEKYIELDERIILLKRGCIQGQEKRRKTYGKHVVTSP
eukprot:8137924-Ditylum_brightwellii.AAC.1